jgi:hypothetical protein
MKTLLEHINESAVRGPRGRWPSMKCGAIFSPCGTFRYALWRIWGEGRAFAVFNGLNPSTADHLEDDPTIRREMGFVMSWPDYDGLIKINAHAFRATDPAVMLAAPDSIGPDNDHWTYEAMKIGAGPGVACWGADGNHAGRADQLRQNYNWRCFGVTKDGHPRHPLYLPKTATLQPLART